MRLPVNISRFGSQGLARRKLPLAIPNLRVAQIANTASFDSVKAFRRGNWGALEHHRPRVLVASAGDLREVGQRVASGAIELSSVDHAIFVLTDLGAAPLTDVVRVVLWQAFGVPVYELFVGKAGILASECETHDGWHVEPGAYFWLAHGELLFDGFGAKGLRTGLSGSIEATTCPCGRQGLRLMNIGLHSHAARSLAAIA
jgi:hypothetical protein